MASAGESDPGGPARGGADSTVLDRDPNAPVDFSTFNTNFKSGKATKVVLVDFDGPVLPNGGSSSSVNNSAAWALCGGREYKVVGDTSNRLLASSLQVSNFIFLDLWFKILNLIPGVYVLPGSQRCAGYNCSEKSLLFTAYLDMYHLFDDFWGRDRKFFRKPEGDFLARGIAAELLNYSKNYLLSAVRRIPDFAHLREQNICLVDDRRTYEGVAQQMGFHFVHCDRGPEEQVLRVARKFIHQHDPRKRGTGLSKKTNALNKGQKVWALYPIPNAMLNGGSDEIPEGSRWHAAHIVSRAAKKAGFGFVLKRSPVAGAATAASSSSAPKAEKEFLYTLQFEGDPVADSQYLIDTVTWAANRVCTKGALLEIVKQVTKANPPPEHVALWPKAKKIYQRFGKLMEKGIEEHHKKQMMQDNALRLEAILNGESVQNFGILRACIDAVFSQLSPPRQAPSNQSLKVHIIEKFSETSYDMHKAQIKAYVDECQVAYKARLLRRRAWQREEIAKAYLKRAADEEDADIRHQSTSNEFHNSSIQRLRHERDEVGLEIHTFVSAYLSAHEGATFAEIEGCVCSYYGRIELCAFRDVISECFLGHEQHLELEMAALAHRHVPPGQGLLAETDGELAGEPNDAQPTDAANNSSDTKDTESAQSDKVAQVAIAAVAAKHLKDVSEQPSVKERGSKSAQAAEAAALAAGEEHLSLRHRRSTYKELYFFARAFLRAADPTQNPITMEQLRQAMIQKFGEPIADHYNVDAEQLYMDNQVVLARSAAIPKKRGLKGSSQVAAPSLALRGGQGQSSVEQAYGVDAQSSASRATLALVEDVESITQALDALNFHGASARLQENPATKKLSTLVVYSAAQGCHYSLHHVASKGGEWISGLKLQYEPGAIEVKVKLFPDKPEGNNDETESNYVSYLEDVKQLSLDSIRRFVFKQLGAKRRKNRSSNEDGSPQSPGAQKNGKDGGHKSNPSRNTSPENASPPVPKVNYTSLISINYYQSFTALRERIAAQFNEFAFALYADQIFHFITEATCAPASSGSSGGSSERRHRPRSKKSSKSGSAPALRINVAKAILAFAQAVVRMSPAMTDRQLELLCISEFGAAWAAAYRPETYNIYRHTSRVRRNASKATNGRIPRRVAKSASPRLLRVASLDGSGAVTTRTMLEVLNSPRNALVTTQLDRVVYIRAPDNGYAVADRQTTKSSQANPTGSAWFPVEMGDLEDFQTGSLRIALAGAKKERLEWIFPEAPQNAANNRGRNQRNQVSEKL